MRFRGVHGWLLAAFLMGTVAAHAQSVPGDTEPPFEGEEEFPPEEAEPGLAEGFLRTQISGSPLCLWWSNRTFTYNVDAAGNAETPGNTEFAAIDKSFESWANVANGCSDFRFVKGPSVTQVEIGYDPDSNSNTNVLTFREKSCDDVVPNGDACLAEDSCGNKYRCWDHNTTTIALTTTTFSFRTGIIFDADIEFNAANSRGNRFIFTTVNSPACEPGAEAVTCVATDVQNTLTHEIGHVVGLDHVNIAGATMEPSAPTGELQKRIIDSGTAAGFCGTYPTGRASPPCDPTASISQKVLALNQGTACAASGASVPFLLTALLLGLTRIRRKR